MSPKLTFVNKARQQVRRMLPKPIARRVYRHQALKYIADLRPDYDPSRKTILAINHLFDQDLEALAHANTRYNFIILDFAAMLKGGKAYFSRDVRDIRAPYESEPLENRLLFRAECRLMFEQLQTRFRPGLIITANDNFAFIREFIHVAHEHGVPTVIVDKEGTISPHSFEAEARRAREYTPCISDHVFVWSRRQKDYWQKRDVSADRITVIGQPRSDLFYSRNEDKISGYFDKRQPLITLFSYFDTAYIPDESVRRGISWTTMKTQTHEDFHSLARSHPDFNFAIKCHPQQQDIDDIRSRYQAPNLRVIGGARVANELIQRSELIIAFQTTSVIEAMFLDKRVIYTAWDENYRSLADDILPFHRAEGIVIADSRERFHGVCRRFFAGDFGDFDFSPEAKAARARFVDGYFYRPDGHVCQRFFAEIDGFVK
jgi:hypothetical protein